MATAAVEGPRQALLQPPVLHILTANDTKPSAPKHFDMEPVAQPRPKKTLVLCFDGTGNKFQGTPADSNIVKIFSLLDREDASQFHYYQPGIGTYVETSSLSQKSRVGRIKSWYIKSKDMAIGTSFGEHVMSGYKFLMRYYESGDEIYFFGFSRGAYTARFLAQMLDYVGLLSAGSEEMLRFAWKTFAQWQMRTEENKEEKQKKRAQFEFMKKFRDTFSRPIERIRFIGLFDCVNSVPAFESAWMRRTRFPYTAKSSARIIRHAVSIDERRAKFRQDLVSEQKPAPVHHHTLHWHHEGDEPDPSMDPKQRPGMPSRPSSHHQARYRPKHHHSHLAPIPSGAVSMNETVSSAASQVSVDSTRAAQDRRKSAVSRHEHDASLHDEDDEQDILEVWFAGQHGDIGGGWTLGEDEERPASDLPLIWMLREARNAGMPFDDDKLEASGLLLPDLNQIRDTPIVRLDGQELPRSNSRVAVPHITNEQDMLRLETATKIHDSLAFGGGMNWPAVLSWQVMEYMPFRRMDLQKNGTWKPISWPLPRGETRDMPDTAYVHRSVIRRMEADGSYRPGNLIIGGGGRVLRRAPEEAGTGNWRVAKSEGDRLGEAVLRVKVAPTGSESKHG